MQQKSKKVSLILKNRIQRFLERDEKWQIVRDQDEHLLFKSNDNVTLHLYSNGRVLIQGTDIEAVYHQLFISSQEVIKLKQLITAITKLVVMNLKSKTISVANDDTVSAVKEGLKNFYINFFDHNHLITFFSPWEKLELNEKNLRTTSQTLKWWINNCKGIRHAGNYSLELLAPGILTCLRILLNHHLI